MKQLLFIFFIFQLHTSCLAQNFYLEIKGNSIKENKTIDSLNYTPTHSNLKSLQNEILSTSEKLFTIGHVENQELQNIKKNDSTYLVKFSLGKKIKSIHIYIGTNPTINTLLSAEKNNTITIPFSQTEEFLNRSLKKLEENGFSLVKLKLVNIQKQNHDLFADLQIDLNQQRNLNAIVVKHEQENQKNFFPKGHLHQINKKYTTKVFNQEVVKNIHNDFEKYRFVNQIKYPEILFTKDSTTVFVYLEKRKSNTFDGYIGFSNNENKKVIFNGYLDLVLENTLKAGEQFTIYWKSDGSNQKTFKSSIDIPYLFKSPIGLKAQINIFKQDSIFQNTKTDLNLGYFFKYNTRIYLGYQSTESSDIQNTSSNTINDYKNSFATSYLNYLKLDNQNPIYIQKTNINIEAGFGKRTSIDQFDTNQNLQQTFININASHNFYLNKKNSFNINYQNYFLKSKTYLTNELYRFGGIKSIRGFAENSLQANFMTALITEYRFLVSQNLYINTILDYCYYEDKTNFNKDNLLGLGFGIGAQTKNGVLKLSFTSGSSNTQKIKFSNTIVSFSYNTNF